MKQIILTSFCGIGDFIRTEPLVRGLHKKYPDANIDFLMKSNTQGLFKYHPYLRNEIVFPADELNTLLNKNVSPLQAIRESLYYFFKALQTREYDLCIGIPHYSDPLINFLILAKENFGAFSDGTAQSKILGNGAKWFYHAHKVTPEERRENNFHLRYHQALLKMCSDFHFELSEEEQAPQLFLSERDLNNAKDYYRKISEKCNRSLKHIALHVGSKVKEKCWPTDRFAAVINSCTRNFSCHFHLGGTAEENKNLIQPLLTKVIDKSNVSVLAGRTSLLEYASFIQEADLVISNDSAPLHMADALHTPVIGLFGATNPYESIPIHFKSLAIIKDSIKEIETDEVISKVASSFDQNRKLNASWKG